ncbi:unnamed protein product [Gongylonema pulchrum]|uniref:Uncharacterized protein n=1 Tax=Gongylonema pulchrum TaxID=637853 RepID=A0A3P6QE56_9BILA|nr:unnamed protein product [Gongylonema pulchrum]
MFQSSNQADTHSPASPHRREGRKTDRRQSHSPNARFALHDERLDRDPAIEMRSSWRQYLIDGSLCQTGAVNGSAATTTIAVAPGPAVRQPMLYYSAPGYRTQPPRYGRDRKY